MATFSFFRSDRGRKNTLLKRIGYNFGWSLLGEIGGKGLLFLVTVYLARVLGAANFGLFSFAQAITSYCWMGVDLGVNMYGSREIAKDKATASEIINPLITLRLLSGSSLFTLFLIFFSYLYRLDPLKQIVFIGFSFYLFTRALNIDWIMRGFERFNYIAFGNFATFLLMLSSIFIFVKSDKDIVIVSFLWSLCYLFGDLLLIYLLYIKLKLSFNIIFDIRLIYHHFKKSIHFTIGNSLLFLYQYLPIIFLGLVASNYEIGIFSAPYRLILSIIYIVSLLPLVLYPTLSELYLSDIKKFLKVYKYLKITSFLTGLLIGLGGLLAADLLIRFLYGPNYEASITIFRIINWFVALTSVRVVYSIAIAVTGLQKYYAITSLFSVIFYSVLFLSMIYGINISKTLAAGYTLLITEIGLIIFLWIIWHFKKVS